MSFGLGRAEVIGRLGADVTVNHLVSGGRVANLGIATSESYIDKTTASGSTAPSGVASSPSSPAWSIC